jgi:serine/threonine-protein kinase HipA
METTIEIFISGEWVKAAELRHFGGHRATFEYLPEYVFGYQAVPVSLAMPVTMTRHGVGEEGAPVCPAFVFDLVPQGLGRKYLLEQLKLPNSDDADIPLAMHGAFNPIGNLRLTAAVEYFDRWREHSAKDVERGFTLEEIVERSDEFVEHIWLHAMLAAGTTGVQGAAPKFLLSRNEEGLWFADAALPDQDAVSHWIVKRPRGRTREDMQVLRNEASYHAVAKAFGLRAEGECFVEGGMLFFERFDRRRKDGQVLRLHQESVVSAAGIAGFPQRVSNFDYAHAILRHVTDPATELAEFIVRDCLNIAMKNTDNHGRNTALQVLEDGTVQLTPIYDFAPMYLDPEMIPRSGRWRIDNREVTALAEILDHLAINDELRQAVREKIAPYAERMGQLPTIMHNCGVDDEIIDACEASIERQARMLEGHYGQAPKTYRPRF